MRRSVVRRAALTALALSMAALAPAGAGRAATTGLLGLSGVDTAGAPDVTAVVTLPPSLVDTGVVPAAFDAEEDGEPRTARVQRLAADRLDVVLAVDTSGSMAGPAIEAARAAAASFVAQIPASARIGIVGFGSRPAVAGPLTTDREAIGAAITGLEAAGETSLYDAVGVALGQFDPGPRSRRHVVLLSDGGDTASTTSLEAVRGRLAGSDVRIDVAELTTAESRHDALASLASAGRGSVVAAADPAALTPIYRSLGRDLVNQFLVTIPTTGTGTTRLRINVDHGGRRASGEVTVELPAPPAAADAGPPAVLLLVAGAALCFAALALAGSLVPVTRTRRVRLLPRPAASGSLPVLTTMTERAIDAADGALERHGKRRGVNAALERAGIALRPGEVLLAAAIVAAVAFAAGTVFGGVLAGAVLAGLVLAGTRVALSVLASRRRTRFQEQLGDNLQLLAGNLRSGHAVLQALDAVAREAEAPSSEELRRVIVEARLGRELNVSLHAMAERLGSEDAEWVAQAIEINREVGGDLAEVLDNLAATIRERARVQRQVKVLTAEGRVSAYVLVALPLVIGGALSVMNPTYFSELTSGVGLVLCGIGAAMLAAGSLWMNRLLKVDY